MQQDHHIYHAHNALRNLGERLALSKAEVVDSQVGTGQDDGDDTLIGVEFPVTEVGIDKAVGHTLEEHIRPKACYSINTHTAHHAILARRESSNTLAEWLVGNVLNLFIAETEFLSSAKDTHTGDALADDKIFGL